MSSRCASRGSGATRWTNHALDQLMPAEEANPLTKLVIAGCHSLAFVPCVPRRAVAARSQHLTRARSDAGLIGDPLEKASFEAIEWSYSRGVCDYHRVRSRSRAMGLTALRPGDMAAPIKGGRGLRILHRFAFQSALKRMSCIIQVQDEATFRCGALAEQRPGARLLAVAHGRGALQPGGQGCGRSHGAALRDGGLPLRLHGSPLITRPSCAAQKPANYDAVHLYYSQKGCRVRALVACAESACALQFVDKRRRSSRSATACWAATN
jgi:magnesium-transporting ATPase (P-type)